MKKSVKIIIGIALIALGALVLVDLLVPSVEINFFFKGFWALFIIIPCFCGLFFDKDKIGPLAGIAVGVLLMLAARDVILWKDFPKYIFAVFVLAFGLTMLFSKKSKNFGHRNDSTFEEISSIDENGRQIKEIKFAFGHQRVCLAGQKFEGASIDCSFAGGELDLRGADILDGAVIKVNCSFAGVKIFVDPQVCVKVAANSSFGSIEDHRQVVLAENAKTLFIGGNCSFGGVEIK